MFFNKHVKVTYGRGLLTRTREINIIPHRGVAQVASAPAWGAGGRAFKSHRPDFPLDFSRHCDMISAMPVLFFLITLTNPVAVVSDSALYRIDLTRMDATRMVLNEEVIDFVRDDYLYVLTRRFLWRLDPQSFKIVDRMLLPERFNYLAVRANDIILIATEEVITVDKKNLSFKSGVGIETGDYKPIVDPRDIPVSKRSPWLYLKADLGTKSILKIFNLSDGRLVRKITIPRALATEYVPDQQALYILDVNGKLVRYGLDLKKQSEIKLPCAGDEFRTWTNGFLIYNNQGLFGVNRNGRLIDFQPLASHTLHTNSFFKYPEGIVQVDLFALRVRHLYPSPAGLARLVEPENGFGLALLAGGAILFLDPDTSENLPVADNPVLPAPAIMPVAGPDSLWYYQVGAFSSRDNAYKLFEDNRARFLPVYIDSQSMYRVKLGGFADKAVGFDVVQGLDLAGWFVYQRRIEFSAAPEFIVSGHAYEWRDGIVRRKE